VRQDRTIQISFDGQQATFVDNTAGVFVTDTGGGQPVRIFQPLPGTVATSVPLWAPADRRLVFAVARRADAQQPAGVTGLDDPDGARYSPGETVYTVYLRPAPRDGDNPAPQELFTAACDHPGYIGANLAVRWRPDGQALLFLDRVEGEQHTLREYDLQTKKSRIVFPDPAPGLVFDFSPSGKHLVCVTGGPEGSRRGVWIGRPDGSDWWRVPLTGVEEGPDRSSLLSRLQAARPVWAPHDSRCLLTIRDFGESNGQEPSCYQLLLATPATREIDALLEETEPLRDLAWSPDGRQFGLVRGPAEAPGTLLVYRVEDLAVRDCVQKVRHFTGWDRSGRQFAYLACGAPEYKADWVALLPADPRACDELIVKPEGEAARAVISRVQVSFPRWSPKESRLSLWASYRFAYGPSSARLLGVGAPPGDPALLVDPATGRLEWKPVSPTDKVQIGHYYLIHGEPATAWRWYEEAEKEFAAARTAPEVRDFYTGRNASLYHAICLERLGRHEQARASRASFERSFPSAWQPGLVEQAKTWSADDWRHVRDRYVVEVLLSVRGLAEAERFLHSGLEKAASEGDRLRKSLLLTQVLLLQGRNVEYADLVIDKVVPLLVKTLPERKGAGEKDPAASAFVLDSAGLLALLPALAPEFLDTLPERQVRTMRERLEQQRQAAKGEARQRVLDVLLAYVSRREKPDDTAGKTQAALEEALRGQPARTP
jgi:hypothetical protein